jgi:DMSO/TMAO reductase YedYZ heme-binding membrane subunit
MTLAYSSPSRRGATVRLVRSIDDFTAWLLYGYETWLVAVLKALPLFLFMYFLIFYVPNYIYYATTLYVLDFSKDVGFLVANGIGAGNFVALIVMAIWAQAARGRTGVFWALIRYLVFAQYLLTILVLIPFMVFNLGGGSFVPPLFPVQSLVIGAVAAVLGAMSFVYLWFEFRRVTRREAAEATTAAGLLSTSR